MKMGLIIRRIVRAVVIGFVLKQVKRLLYRAFDKNSRS